MKDFMYKATVGGQYLFFTISFLMALPAIVFHVLQASSALVADRLARKRYGIKEEAPPYFKMISRDIVRELMGIKNPVLASHQEFVKSPEEWPHEKTAEADERGAYADDSALDHHRDDGEEPSEHPATN